MTTEGLALIAAENPIPVADMSDAARLQALITVAVRTPKPERREVRDLAGQLAHYLGVRHHTLSTAHLTGMEQLMAEAEYVPGDVTVEACIAEKTERDRGRG